MAAERDDSYQETVAMAVAAAARVRELLWEMQRGADGGVPGSATAAVPPATWNDKDREAVERARLEELRTCVVDDAALQQLQRLPKRMCAYEFKPGDIAWNCKVCQVDETCVMCNECFIASDHENHEVFFYYTHSGGCCDCGDTEAWAPEGFCTQHRGAQDADPVALLPHRFEVLDLVLETITEARRSSILQTSDIENVRARLARAPPDQRYSVLVHYNELQNSHEFASLLARALPSISYQTLKIVGEASAQKQSIVRAKGTRDEALDVAEALNRNGLVASVVPSDYKTKIPVVSTLLLWLVSLANLSDGVCRLICEQFISHHQRRRGSSSSSDSDVEIQSDGMEDDEDDEMKEADTEYPLLPSRDLG
ncbi:hypothetical protein PINS_up005031 [Pythium insidiosum]|nr:hypothetical protein PINS_up005031 [Pythium insidiosum]